MKHVLILIITILAAGCTTQFDPKIDRNAAMFFTSRVEHDVVYRTVDGKDQLLNLYLPDNFIGKDPWFINDGKGKKPTLLHIHGGGWVEGSKDQIVLNLLPYIFRDWVVISINYRLADEAKAPAAVDDCLAALQWVHNNAEKYDIDTNRIVLSGGSAGGHLALLTGMLKEGDLLCEGKLIARDAGDVAAIVNWYGVADFEINPHPMEWFGESIDLNEYVKTLSPINYVRKGGPPVLTVHGTLDEAVPVKQAVDLHEKLREAGIHEQLVLIQNKKHGDFSAEELTEIYQKIWKFLESAGVKTNVD
jgi:acetyl esterase/lipase